MTVADTQQHALYQLADRYGIEKSYVDAAGRVQRASTEALLATLRALGAPLESVSDAVDALEHRRRAEWELPCDPVVVAWDGVLAVELRLPAKLISQPAACTIVFEDGHTRRINLDLNSGRIVGAARFPGGSILAREIVVPLADIPPGYHQAIFEVADHTIETTIISAPRRAYQGPDHRMWGLFVPLYAVRSRANWGAGNYADLEGLYERVRNLGGDLVGTLPLLPTYIDEPFDPSPYAPVSRLFWSEFYIDVARVPEYQESQTARDLVASEEFQRQLEDARSSEFVEYRRIMALKRKVLFELAKTLFTSAQNRQAALRRWVERHPEARNYARFRALVEVHGANFRAWPEHLKFGNVSSDDVDSELERYHLYVQWVARNQLRNLADQAKIGGSGLYLDLPLGVHADGYDNWRNRDVFVEGASVGAPPDPLHQGGQNWGFPPLHPDNLRARKYDHFIQVIRHHMRYAGTLRIDHVMGLHRQFWIPPGMEATDGVYVRYPADDLYAILALESQRHKTMLIGEDLGTVPEYVRPKMEEHGMYRMSVLPFALTRERDALAEAPAHSMASLNTHDIPPFAGMWADLADAERETLIEVLTAEGLVNGDASPRAILESALKHLAMSKAKMMMINIEDLWLEPGQQNVPGTTIEENPNWQRKARYDLETAFERAEVRDTLKQVNSLRKLNERSTHNDETGEDTPGQ